MLNAYIFIVLISRLTSLQLSPTLGCSSSLPYQHKLYSTEAIPVPQAEGADKIFPPKIQSIVNDISQLTLLEVADLNELLKVSS